MELRSESDWLRMYSGKIAVKLLPDPACSGLGEQTFNVQADSRMKVGQLKEQIASMGGPSADKLRIVGTRQHIPL